MDRFQVASAVPERYKQKKTGSINGFLGLIVKVGPNHQPSTNLSEADAKRGRGPLENVGQGLVF